MRDLDVPWLWRMLCSTSDAGCICAHAQVITCIDAEWMLPPYPGVTCILEDPEGSEESDIFQRLVWELPHLHRPCEDAVPTSDP